jgi:hypothetical protein
MYYNFGRVEQTLRVTPAVEASIWITSRPLRNRRAAGLIANSRSQNEYHSSRKRRSQATVAGGGRAVYVAYRFRGVCARPDNIRSGLQVSSAILLVAIGLSIAVAVRARRSNDSKRPNEQIAGWVAVVPMGIMLVLLGLAADKRVWWRKLTQYALTRALVPLRGKV